MKRLFVLCCCLFVSLPRLGAADAATDKVTYYVQLVRGTDENTPPLPEARRIGPKLAKLFKPVFRWQHYWEIALREVNLARGQKTRIRLSPQREVAIDLTKPGKRMVITYLDGKEFSRDTRPSGDSMTIIGGDKDTRNSWFIVVRHDKPSY
jgi:hypothetical protein